MTELEPRPCQPLKSASATKVASGLYPRLLGEAWHLLAEPVRRAHCQGPAMSARGKFAILGAGNLPGRLVARALRMPRPRAQAEVTLNIRPDGEREEWLRSFDGDCMTTIQTSNARGEMVEWFAGMGLRFHLRVVEGGLHYEQVGASLGTPWLRFPRWLSPHVAALEVPIGPSRVEVRVCVQVPLLGRIIGYEGHLDV